MENTEKFAMLNRLLSAATAVSRAAIWFAGSLT